MVLVTWFGETQLQESSESLLLNKKNSKTQFQLKIKDVQKKKKKWELQIKTQKQSKKYKIFFLNGQVSSFSK